MFSVLYVDDEPGLLDIGKIFLESFGDFSVSTVTSASAALENLKTEQFDAIIADYQMPGMDGLEFLKQVRLRHGHIPFILFTGRGREEVVITALNLGADFYLQKGGDPQAQFTELAFKVRQAVQRWRIEAALEESESRYRAVIESQTELICRFRPDGTLLFVNGAFCTYYGKTIDELIGRPFRPEVFFEDRLKIAQHFSSLSHENPVGIMEHRILMPDGSIRWQKWNDRVIFDENDRIAEFQSVGHDITDRKQMEATLADNRDYLDQIFSSVQSGIVVIDAGTHEILDLNPAAAKMMGTTKDGILHKVCHCFICPAEQGRCPITDLGQTVDNSERVLLAADGRKVPIIKYVVRFSYHGRECLLETFIDNTDRRKSEDKLREAYEQLTSAQEELREQYDELSKSQQLIRESGDKFRTIFEESPYPVTINSIPDGKFIAVNKAFLKSSGFSEPEVMGKSPAEIGLLSLVDYGRLSAHLLVSGKLENVPMALKGKGGAIIHVQFSVIPVTINNRPAILTMTAEVTKLKRVEEELLKKTDDLHAAYTNLSAIEEELREKYEELRKNEQALRASEEKFRQLITLAPVPMSFSNDRGEIEFINRRFEELFGYTHAEIPTLEDWFLRAYPDAGYRKQVLDTWDAAVQRASENKTDIEPNEYAVTCRDGIVRKVMISGITIEGKLLAIFTDVTEQRSAEDALRESENRWRLWLERSPVAMALYRLDGTAVFSNRQFGNIIGWTIDDIRDLESWWKAVYPDPLYREQEKTAWLARVKRAAASGDYIEPQESRIFCKDGTTRLLEFSGLIIGDMVLATYYDLTRRKAAEEALRESEHQFRALVEVLPDGVVVHRKGKIVYANPETLRLVGAGSAGDLIGKEVLSFVHPDYRPLVLEHIRLMIDEDRTNPPEEECFLALDGRPFDVEVSSKAISYEGLPSIMVVFRDITKRKRAETALRESDEKLRGILDNIQDVYYRSDMEGNLIMFSPSGARLLGYDTPEDFLGKSIAETLYANPADRAGFLKAVSETGAVRDYEVNLRHRSGAVITISASSHYYFAPDGTVAGIEGIFRDITEKKRAEEELKRSENLYRTVFETTGAATILIGADTTILKANAAMEKLTGVSRSDQENKLSWTVFIDRDDVERMKQYHYARRKNPAGVPTLYECRLIDAQKGMHFCYVYVDIIPGTKNSIASLIDITPVKRAEEALRQANRKLSLLTGITRHDINNQLTLLQGYCGLIEKNTIDPQLNGYLRKAKAAALRISSMIRFTKEYEALGITAPVWQDVRSLLDTVIMQAPLGHVVVENTVPAHLEVLADPLIVKAFYNLMDNSLRHGGETVTAVWISVKDRDGEKVIVWADDGCGVPEAEKEQIFEPGIGKNTGLGLTLSKEILAITGMKITETGVPGKGARFEIAVPKGAYRFAGR